MLDQNIDEKEAQLQQSQENVHALDASLEGIKEQLRQAQGTIGTLNETIEEEQSHLQQSQETVQTLNENLRETGKQLQVSQDNASSLNRSLELKEAELHQSDLDKREMRRKLQESETAKTTAETQLQICSDTKEKAEAELQQRNSDFVSVQNKLRQCESDKLAVEKELQQQKQSSAAKLQMSRSETETFKQDLQQCQTAKTLAESNGAKAFHTIETLDTEVSNAKSAEVAAATKAREDAVTSKTTQEQLTLGLLAANFTVIELSEKASSTSAELVALKSAQEPQNGSLLQVTLERDVILSELEEKTQAHADAVSRIEDARREKCEEIEDKAHQKINALEQRHVEQSQDTEASNAEKVEDLKSQHLEEVQKANQAHQEEVLTIKQDSRRQAARLESEQTQELARLEQQSGEKLEHSEKGHSDAVAILTDDHTAALAEVKSELTLAVRKQVSSEKETENLRQQLDEASATITEVAKLKSDLSQLRQEKAALQCSLNNEIDQRQTIKSVLELQLQQVTKSEARLECQNMSLSREVGSLTQSHQYHTDQLKDKDDLIASQVSKQDELRLRLQTKTKELDHAEATIVQLRRPIATDQLNHGHQQCQHTPDEIEDECLGAKPEKVTTPEHVATPSSSRPTFRPSHRPSLSEVTRAISMLSASPPPETTQSPATSTSTEKPRKHTRQEKRDFTQIFIEEEFNDLARQPPRGPGDKSNVNVPGAPTGPKADRDPAIATAITQRKLMLEEHAKNKIAHRTPAEDKKSLGNLANNPAGADTDDVESSILYDAASVPLPEDDRGLDNGDTARARPKTVNKTKDERRERRALGKKTDESETSVAVSSESIAQPATASYTTQSPTPTTPLVAETHQALNSARSSTPNTIFYSPAALRVPLHVAETRSKQVEASKHNPKNEKSSHEHPTYEIPVNGNNASAIFPRPQLVPQTVPEPVRGRATARTPLPTATVPPP